MSRSVSRRDCLVVEYLPLARAIAIQVMDEVPPSVELADLIQSGVLGLIDAAAKYDSSKNVAFGTYAKFRIRGAILDSLRELDWASRDTRRHHRHIKETEAALTAELQRSPSEDEIADRIGIDETRLRQLRKRTQEVQWLSLSHHDPDAPVREVPDNKERPDDFCYREEMRHAVNAALDALPERYRKVVTLYYSDEMTMKQIGDLIGVNESRVSQIHKSALSKVAASLTEAGVTGESRRAPRMMPAAAAPAAGWLQMAG